MESKTPLSPQQRRATQAAPTLRLKLKLGASEAQLSVPGSEDEDASRVRLPATCHCEALVPSWGRVAKIPTQTSALRHHTVVLQPTAKPVQLSYLCAFAQSVFKILRAKETEHLERPLASLYAVEWSLHGVCA